MNESELERVREFSRQAETEALLDRVTAFRADHDPEAIRIFESELFRRGVDKAEIEQKSRESKGNVLTRTDGSVARCEICERPARQTVWAWYRLWGKVPLFPRPIHVCDKHLSGRSD
ncbi:MAG: hypothetical protein U0798_20780 [Gemmataceae bacterium]